GGRLESRPPRSEAKSAEPSEVHRLGGGLESRAPGSEAKSAEPGEVHRLRGAAQLLAELVAAPQARPLLQRFVPAPKVREALERDALRLPGHDPRPAGHVGDRVLAAH